MNWRARNRLMEEGCGQVVDGCIVCLSMLQLAIDDELLFMLLLVMMMVLRVVVVLVVVVVMADVLGCAAVSV